MATEGKRYTREYWTPDEFERAITEPTPADREKWEATDWVHNLPLIPMPKEEREALRAKQAALVERIACTPEELAHHTDERRRVSARILGPEAAHFYAEHFGIAQTEE